jgi:hypothetical protein
MNSHSLKWVGSQKNYVDEINVAEVGSVTVGRFGGNSSAGQYKNEDGCMVWTDVDGDWEFTMILDAHKTAQSAELVIDNFHQQKRKIERVLMLSVGESLKKLDSLILEIFQAPDFLEACRMTTGETACLIVIRKEKYLWWFSIGDCILNVFHPELMALGEMQLNQRSFYEWVGEVNTFELPVPCYSTGKKELRQGVNQIFMTTDGLTECPGVPFENPVTIKGILAGRSNRDGVCRLLKDIEQKNVRDSTTVVAWSVKIKETASMPSDL